PSARPPGPSDMLRRRKIESKAWLQEEGDADGTPSPNLAPVVRVTPGLACWVAGASPGAPLVSRRGMCYAGSAGLYAPPPGCPVHVPHKEAIYAPGSRPWLLERSPDGRRSPGAGGRTPGLRLRLDRRGLWL